jgi:hypothetical protein
MEASFFNLDLTTDYRLQLHTTNDVHRLSHPCSSRFSGRYPSHDPHIVPSFHRSTSYSFDHFSILQSCSPLVFFSTRAALSTEEEHRVGLHAPFRLDRHTR